MTTEEFLTFLYSGVKPGYAVVQYGSPPNRTGGGFIVPHEIEAMAGTIRALARTHDVYMSVYAFPEPKRRGNKSLPSDILFIDQDDPAVEWRGVEPTLRVESSPGKYHSYFKVDRQLPGDEALRYLKAMVSEGEGDAAAADRARILRPVGSWSYKRGNEVRAVGGSGEVYSVEQVVGDRNVPAPRTHRRGKPDGTDLSKWLTANGIPHSPVDDDLGVKYLVDCPHAAEHTPGTGDTMYVGKRDGGGLYAWCHHASCEPRRTWRAYAEVVGPKPKRLRISGREVGKSSDGVILSGTRRTEGLHD
jgi:hypothetical protein